MNWIYEANILIHVVFGLACLIIGAYLLIESKGDNRHKKLGKIYVSLMAGILMTSVFIKQINDGAFSWLHLLSALTLIALIYALIKIKQKKINHHKQAMTGIYIGLCIAGILSVSIPGRFFSS